VARIRTIKPEFPQSESMGNVTREARLCFIMLWTIADDSGRLRGASRMLASLLFPYDNDAPKLMDKWLGELEQEKCIARYEVDGAQYVQIANWLDHQKIDRPSQSKFPPFDESSRIVAKPREPSSGDLRTKDQGPKDQGIAQAQSEIEVFWEAYPRKKGKGATKRALEKATKKAPIEIIMAGLKATKFSDDPQFIPYPATWLNEERWSDPPEAPVGPDPRADPHDTQWRARLNGYKPGGYWPDVWGSRPGEPGCVAPAALLREYGL
jgi:hypothetical protein